MAHTPPASLSEWLAYIEQLHRRPIELGLDRVGQVRERLGLGAEARPLPLILTVGGTNGKGSTCAMLEAILMAAGYRVGLYTSPHLVRYNERVRIQGKEADDAMLCAGFAEVEAARTGTTLSYFEFGTLAAMVCFTQAQLDVVILEVGLGGRLDAVNIFEPHCSIITGVAMDHMDYLGDTREAIGFEKAGIYRAGRPAVCGDPDPPETLVRHAERIGADLRIAGRDFSYAGDKTQWTFKGRHTRRASLAYPALRGVNQLLNASAALAALEALEDRLPVPMQAVRQGLMLVELPGRFQVLPGRPAIVLDVAHNPQSAAVLAENLFSMGFYPNTLAVCGMLADKDIEGTLAPLVTRVDQWFFCDLSGPRGASAQRLAEAARALGSTAPMHCFHRPAEAFDAARAAAGEGDRITCFGSFLTVSELMQHSGVKP